MKLEEIEEIVNHTEVKKYLVKKKDGQKEYIRLWKGPYDNKVARIDKYSHSWGTELNHDMVKNWESIKLMKWYIHRNRKQ